MRNFSGKSSEVTVLPSASASTNGCSSTIHFSCACAAVMKAASSTNSRAAERNCILSEHRGWATQHRPGIAVAARDADPVEIFEHLDCQIAADTGAVLEFGRGEVAFRRGFGQFARDRGEALDRLGQEEAVGRDLCDPAKTLDPPQKASQRLRLQ